MNTSKLLISILFVLLLAGCSDSDDANTSTNNEDSAHIEDEALPQVDEVFPELNQYLINADSSFSIEGFEGGQTETKTDSTDQNISNQTISKYLPYLIFNADSTYALDLVINNYVPVEKNDEIVLVEGGPDFEVGLISLRNNKRKQLLFFGTMGVVMDAKWTDNNTIMIAGANEMNGDSIRPVIWTYDIPSKAWSVYTYDKMIAADASNFPKKWKQQKGNSEPAASLKNE